MSLFKGYIEELRPLLVDSLILRMVNTGVTTVTEVERNIRALTFDLGGIDVRKRISHLERNGHLKLDHETLYLTEDARLDIQRAMPWFREILQVGAAPPRAR